MISEEPKLPLLEGPAPISSVKSAVTTFIVGFLTMVVVREDPVPRARLWMFVFLIPIVTIIIELMWRYITVQRGLASARSKIKECELSFSGASNSQIPFGELLAALHRIRFRLSSAQMISQVSELDQLCASIQKLQSSGYSTFLSVDPETRGLISRQLRSLRSSASSS